MSGRPRVLFLAPRSPWPADTGGKIRTQHILRQMARWADVDVVCFGFGDDFEPSGQHRPAGVTSWTQVAPPSEGGWHGRLVRLIGDKPYSIQKYESPPMRKVVRERLARERYDAVHADHLHMMVYADLCREVPIVLDEHNVEFLILERLSGLTKHPVRRWLYRDQAEKTRRFEAWAVGRASRVCAVSDDDRKELGRLCGRTPVHVVPNGVDVEYFCEDKEGKGVSRQFRGEAGSQYAHKCRIVFTGSMDWLPNDDAMRWALTAIMPRIWSRVPEACLDVVGRSPSPALERAAGQDDRVRVTGRVEDVRPFLWAADVFLVPIRMGSGTRLKILEAMAAGKPVVSTRLGAEGIAYTEGQNIVLADTPEELAEAVAQLLNNAEKARALGAAGQDLVKHRYDWAIVGQTLKQVYDEIIRT